MTMVSKVEQHIYQDNINSCEFVEDDNIIEWGWM